MARTGTGRPAPGGRFWVLFAVAVAAGAGLAGPYLTLRVGSGRIHVTGDLHWYVLVAHILTALVALVLGPLQFVPAVRARGRVHRAIGRCYLLAGVLPSSLAAVPVALLSGRPLTQVALTVAAAGWLATGLLAHRAARRRDFEAHRAWMTRNYALTFLAVTSRVLVPLMLLAQLPFRASGGRPSFAAESSTLIPIGQTLGWMVNLAVAETMIRRRARGTRGARRTAGAAPGAGP
jgi:hypothetical protein